MIDSDQVLIGIVIAIANSKPGSDLKTKIADRFSHENRIPVLRSVCTLGSGTGFQSRSDLKMKIANRFWSENRDPIAKWKSVSDFFETLFDRRCGCDEIWKWGSDWKSGSGKQEPKPARYSGLITPWKDNARLDILDLNRVGLPLTGGNFYHEDSVRLGLFSHQ